MSKSVPNLIILDVMMVGETDGIHFAKTLKDNPKTVSIPVLMMTSIGRKRNFRFEGEKDKDYLPVDDFLDKPAAPDVLLKHVETLLLR
jgi:CheY-like chemotaxis protein